MSKQNESLCSEVVFRSVFDAHFKLLRNFLAFRFRNVDSAEDIAQNAFVALWQHCASLEREQARSFLFTTAIRMSLNAIKHDKVAERFEVQARPATVCAETPEFLMVESEVRHRLERAIADLPEKQRVVFLMNRLENQSYSAIAALLGISVKAVEKRMHLALIALRKVIQNI